MTVSLPEGEGLFPALVVMHGGGFRRGGRFGPFFPALYAARGIAGFSIDYQLSKPGAPSWPTAVQDVICAIRHIKENATRYRIDPDRVAVMGHSAGGYLATMVGTLRGDEPFLAGACGDPNINSQVVLVVDYSGLPDLEWYGMNNPDPWAIAQYLRATYTENPELWRLASPINHVSPDDGAVFVVGRGTLDTSTTVEISTPFIERLKESGIEKHFVVIEGANHAFFRNDEHNLEMRQVFEPIMRRLLRP